ncbi:hypothetical protein BOTBODRAFT_51736 [Botryobasidium botryosum FD-172 SS1]|uniref:Aminoglycoside phosphotransferase domain-containing protein n=1 Tax=Botryobasidium botryosum (strain FD-172 SS1) TaxID=930990 RepID=A0A067MUM6_BOTB1|nr:hypothetical protein BOTBODRAFT_51736 [Botryobasidium botryosum FD-172 SS1]
MILPHPLAQGTQSPPAIHSTLTTAQRHIVDFCTKGPGTYIIPSSLGSQVFVKRGNASLKAEARTQAYLYAQAQSSALAICVPKVYDVFSDGTGSTYLVMEHVTAPSFHAWISEPNLFAEEQTRRADIAADAIANTIEVLLRCPLPEGNGIGPVGGGYIQHSFFSMAEAPVPFVNATALESYVNKALERRPGRPQIRVSLETEARLLCPSDVSLKNFLWDPVNERVWMIDYQHVNVLPHSFASLYFHSATDAFVKSVAKKISLPVSSQLNLLQSAAGIVLQSSNSSFGLDENGAAKSRRGGSHIARLH